ncbi:hypothetical protein B0T26DRAFT_757691 [Lasiosphaeria miniovina]|uniref:RNA polymerase II subunit B1 CTD phosphatase RPAP2 homolog n=1 Tax=Lasiosphaeria miniovina TaxID=1954250 RepID=A0AA39ZQA3_9PEZI|nr:uncharacterized protein B0T26DRAFT_757691 [Lasiosphaeria miniovina]KAK0701695.1 hypothetical protein B0T26DRAFT_757691 [Lasiosphaeria miniovina]
MSGSASQNAICQRQQTPKPPKGIPKPRAQSSAPPHLGSTDDDENNTDNNNAARVSREHLAVIHEQARWLQQLRDEEIRPAVLVETFERLSQFPVDASASATRPSASDAGEFVAAVEGFLPSEYADLIEERNCLGKCGYALCPRPKRAYIGEFKIMASGIARVDDLNKWCSDDCAARALSIKVQLDNPTYLRKNGQTIAKIELREEKNGEKEPTSLASANDQELAQAEASSGRQAARAAAALSVERGDAGRPPRPGTMFNLTIREKITVSPAQPPDHEQLVAEDRDTHLRIEGHRIKFGTNKVDEESDDDDIPATIRL